MTDTTPTKLDMPFIADKPTVRSILASKKTQMRKVMIPQPTGMVDGKLVFSDTAPSKWHNFTDINDMCQFGKIGGILRVQEPFRLEEQYDDALAFEMPTDVPVAYEVDGIPEGQGFGKPRKSQSLARWATRIFLQITDIRVEKMHDISDEDAIAEGATSKPECFGYNTLVDGWNMDWPDVEPAEGWGHIALTSPRLAYASYANSVGNGGNYGLKRGKIWDQNPWVWVIGFERIFPS